MVCKYENRFIIISEDFKTIELGTDILEVYYIY